MPLACQTCRPASPESKIHDPPAAQLGGAMQKTIRSLSCLALCGAAFMFASGEPSRSEARASGFSESSAFESSASETSSFQEPGFLGIEVTGITSELREHFGAPEGAGLLVSKVDAGSPAEDAGLEVGDILIAADGDEVVSASQLSRAIRRSGSGSSLDLEVVRNGSTFGLTAILAERDNSEWQVRTARGAERAERSRERSEQARERAGRARERADEARTRAGERAERNQERAQRNRERALERAERVRERAHEKADRHRERRSRHEHLSEQHLEELAERMAEMGERWAEAGERFGANLDESDLEEWGESWGQWGEEFGERMGNWGEDFGERWGAWGEEFGSQFAEAGERLARAFDDHDWEGGNWDDLGAKIEAEVERGLDSIDWDQMDRDVDEQLKNVDIDQLQNDVESAIESMPWDAFGNDLADVIESTIGALEDAGLVVVETQAGNAEEIN